MIRAIGKHLAPALWLLGLVIAAGVVGGYIVSHQRLTWPTWAPLVGKQYYRLDARFTDAAGVLPGQGNAVMVSGVKVGEITGVHLDRGTAVLGMRIDERFGHVRPDATLLMRPKTSLQDMVVELDPGTAAAGPELPSGTTLGLRAGGRFVSM